MTKRFPVLHPVLFAAYPVLAALARNIGSITPGEAIRPLIVIILIAGALLLVLWLALKDWHRAGFLTSLVLIITLYYGYAYYLPKLINIAGVMVSRHLVFASIWVVALSVAGSNWLWKRVRPQVITNFLNLLSGISLILPARIILLFLLSVNKDPLTGWTRPANANEDSYRLAGDYRPDIYYIIADGYARADVLQETYRFDNSDFISFLTERGFYVASQSHTNYVQTGLSLASSLNMEYLDYLAIASQTSANRYPLHDLITTSRVHALLHDLGYQTVSLSSGYLLTEIKDADLYLSPHIDSVTEFEGLLLATSAAQIFVDTQLLDIPTYGYETHRKRVQYAFEQLAHLPNTRGPKFVFAHIVTPHPPFVFDRHGNPVQPNWAYFIGDGTHFQGTTDDYIKGYTEQVLYANTLLEKTIDAILANSETPPIIILQADHGPGAYLNWESVQQTCLKERTAILNAYYLPSGGKAHLYDSITPVNSFRVVFDTYFGTHLGPLQEKSYYTTWSHPYEFIDVTDKNSAPCE